MYRYLEEETRGGEGVMEILKYPHVIIKYYPGLAFKDMLFADGKTRTHQHTCPIDCVTYRGKCKFNGDAMNCSVSYCNITEPEDEDNDSSPELDCDTCKAGNIWVDGAGPCTSCDEDYSSYALGG